MNPKQNRCPFCMIVAGDAPARVIYDASTTLAFLPLNPAVVGHTLLIPRAHSVGLLDTEDEFLEDIARVSKFLAARIIEVTGARGLNIIQSNGSCATQTITHYHMHLVPRFDGDNFGPIWPTVAAPEAEVSEFFDSIRNALP